MEQSMPEEIVEAAPIEGETSSESASEPQEPQEGEPKPKGGFQKRIDKLTRHNTQLEQEKEYWRTQALRTPPETKTAPKVEGKPSEDNFQTHAEFLEALTDWKVDQRLKAEKSTSVAEQVKTQQQKALQEFAAKEQEFRAKTPDFDEVMADAEDVQASDGVIAEIVTSGPELKYYLAKNPAEVERLNKLAPLALAREVGKIESRFTTSEQRTAPKTTAAPPPPTPTAKSTPTSTKDPGEMNPSEYRAWRAKQTAK
jgi:hypothetical protein